MVNFDIIFKNKFFYLINFKLIKFFFYLKLLLNINFDYYFAINFKFFNNNLNYKKNIFKFLIFIFHNLNINNF